jgi:hypothetical protein
MKAILAILIGGFLSCQQAQAFSGAIEFFGSANASGPSDTSLDTIHFINPWQTLAGTGSYSTVPLGTSATLNNFSFIGDGTAATLAGPDNSIWRFTVGPTTYSFDLLTLTNGHVSAGAMAFTGTGIVHIGLNTMPAAFALQGAGSGFKFKLSSSTTATTSVPDGGTTVSMLGLGLMLIGLVRRYACP